MAKLYEYELGKSVVKRVNMPVVEPAVTALKTLEILIDLKISHSKTGLYITPEVGKIIGY
jgi:Asp/Glu/hydantoin racemase